MKIRVLKMELLVITKQYIVVKLAIEIAQTACQRKRTGYNQVPSLSCLSHNKVLVMEIVGVLHIYSPQAPKGGAI